MPEQLDIAVTALAKYFNISTRRTLIEAALGEVTGDNTSTAKPNTSINGTISNALIDIQTGAKSAVDINTMLYNISSNVPDDAIAKKFIAFTSGDNYVSKKYAKKTSDIANELNKNLSVFCVRTSGITPAMKNIDALALFLTAIPSIELSRCVPYLTITALGRQTGTKDSKNNSTAFTNTRFLTLPRFLDGDASSNNETAKAIYSATSPIGHLGIDNPFRAEGGMELFTSPQTLVNANGDKSAGRAARIIDIYRPFMTITKLALDISPAGGAMSYKAGTLEITLHDRSRLSEIADMVSPAYYANTELMIEYGWSHPEHDALKSPYGALINAMRLRELYGISSSSYNFDKAGQVNITMQIFMRGIAELNRTINSETKKESNTVASLRNELTKLLMSVGKATSEKMTELRVSEVLNDLGDTMAPLKLEPGLIKQMISARSRLDAAMKSKKGGAALSELGPIISKLKELYGTDGKQGATASLRGVIDSVVKSKLKQLASPGDPFMDQAIFDALTADNKPITKYDKKKYTTLGRVMSLFIGDQLANVDDFSGKTVETHLIFYTFNDGAGAIRKRCIAEFLIDISRFTERLNEIALVRQGMNITLRDLLSIINNIFIDDRGSINYGMSDVYESKYNSESGRVENNFRQNVASDEKTANSLIEQKMQFAGITNGQFVPPMIDYYIEGLTCDSKSSGTNKGTESIIRLHIIDRISTPYATQGAMLAAKRDSSVSELQTMMSDDNETMSTIVDKAKESDFIKVDEHAGHRTFSIKGGVDALKQFIASTMPTVVYGSGASAIKDAKLSSEANPALATINMMKASHRGPQQSNGLAVGNMPLRIFPASLDLTLFGCPLLEFMQQIFFDFGTGTTADNIYTCIHVSHEISHNTFTTTAKMTPTDSYGKYDSTLGMLNKLIAHKEKIDEVNRKQK